MVRTASKSRKRNNDDILQAVKTWALASMLCLLCGGVTPAIEIVVDYSYDSETFFDTPQKRDALQAAADRYSRVINSSLLAVSPEDSTAGWRIGFTHPGTGDSVQLSTAADLTSDPLFPASPDPADVYGFAGLAADTWILFAGGRELSSAGVGGTATGINFTTTLNDEEGPLHRGLIPNTPDDTVNDLPVWGGSISFDSRRAWHFDLDAAAGPGDLDFYSIALHEIGHALGLNTSWNQWSENTVNGSFTGPHALAAYNQDHGSSIKSLELESSLNAHWQDGRYQSRIFPLGQPVSTGTVGIDAFQDLLMEPTANFTPTVSRLELTNVDAAALVDLGWSIITGPTLDLNGDQQVDGTDVDLACMDGADLTPYFSALGSLPGDLDLNGHVAFADFLRLSSNFGQPGAYSDGDIDCSGHVQFQDFLILSTAFGQSAAVASSVPEPHGMVAMLLGSLVFSGFCRRRR